MIQRFLIGLDDTDSIGGRGTGFQAMQLGEMITINGLGDVRAISRHQLLLSNEIPATSDNSAACIELYAANLQTLTSFCAQFVKDESSLTSNAGLCIAPWNMISDEFVAWGRKAKKSKLSLHEALDFAHKHGIFLEGLKGSHSGAIGALAAVSLRRSGFDGRFLWLERLRDLSGVYSAEDLIALVRAEAIINPDGLPIHPDDRVEVGEWFRPVNINHQITILVEKIPSGSDVQWKTASRQLTLMWSDLNI